MFAPIARTLRRYVLAAKASSMPASKSYAQSGEDEWLNSRITDSTVENGIYIDVGANHPTLISNTYLFYRRGGSGIIIEPNRGFRDLYRYFRKRDTVLTVGCGATHTVEKFFTNRYAVLSSFIEAKGYSDGSFEYVPIITLDDLKNTVDGKAVYLLSIDVEGLNYEVLKGAGAILPNIEWLVIECGDDRASITDLLMRQSFALAHETKHNLIFQRKTLNQS